MTFPIFMLRHSEKDRKEKICFHGMRSELSLEPLISLKKLFYPLDMPLQQFQSGTWGIYRTFHALCDPSSKYCERKRKKNFACHQKRIILLNFSTSCRQKGRQLLSTLFLKVYSRDPPPPDYARERESHAPFLGLWRQRVTYTIRTWYGFPRDLYTKEVNI